VPRRKLPTAIGVEIEVAYRRLPHDIESEMRLLRRRFRAAGLKWDVKPDNSCGPVALSAGIEVTSPILRKVSDLGQISTVLLILRELEFHINERCGLHIHLDMRKTTREDRERLMSFLVRYEEAFFQMAPLSRQDSNFCLRFPAALIQDFRAGRDRRSWNPAYHPIGRPRYFWMNGSMSVHSTYEFRLMQSTLDEEQVLGWTKLLLLVFSNFVLHRKTTRWGRAVTKSKFILACSMVERAGCYNKKIDGRLREEARAWVLDRLKASRI
jgi:hypothetical protein